MGLLSRSHEKPPPDGPCRGADDVRRRAGYVLQTGYFLETGNFLQNVEQSSGSASCLVGRDYVAGHQAVVHSTINAHLQTINA